MCDCADCFQVAIDPLVGQEPWRKSRLVGATGPTGPDGVVQDMASPTGPYSALIDNDQVSRTWPFFQSTQANRILGVPGPEMMGVFVGVVFGSHGQFYRDGTCRLTTMATADCSRGAWIEVEVVPRQDYPQDSVARQSLPFSVNRLVNDFTNVVPESVQESIGFILDERPLRVDGYRGPYTDPPEFGVGPVRIRAGYNGTTLFDVYDSSAADGAITAIGLMPFTAGSQADATRTRIASNARVKGVAYCFPVDAPTSAIFADGEAQSDLRKHNAVTVGFDASRMIARPDVTQEVRPPAVGGSFRSVVSDNYTDVIVPTNATGPVGAVPLTAASLHQTTTYFNDIPGQDLTERFWGQYWFSNTKGADQPQVAMNSLCRAVNGPTWHERNIIRYGGALAVDGARHQVRLTFDWQAPEPSNYCTASVFDNLGVSYSEGFEVTCNPPFDILAGAIVDLLPVMAGRNLLPGQYASGPVQLTPISITSIPGTFSTGGNVSPLSITDANVPVAISITPIVHAWATSSIRNRIVITENAVPELPRTPTSWSSLSLPGTNGMTLDQYVHLLPTLNNLDSRKWPAATHVLAVDLEIWFRITCTSVDTSGFNVPSFSGNITRYFQLVHPTLTFVFTDEEAGPVSDGIELQGARVVVRAAELNSFPGGNVPNKEYVYAGNPYKINFSTYQP